MPWDLRSDTVTRPTSSMRAAIASAQVGDDCWGDDPTVTALERNVAARLGKDAAVFVPSGTMANQLAVRIHCRPGDAIATHPGAHVQIHEDASAAGLSGAQIMPIGSRRGFTVQDLQALVAEEACGWPPVRLVWLENTVGDAGGTLWPLDDASLEHGHAGVSATADIARWARSHGRAVHLDGARLWNAHIASGIALDRLAAVGDTVSVALSKGLGAPMGSLLAGPVPLIQDARRLRHALGGGLRQAGLVAAAGLYALEHNLSRLAEDHRRAQQLATEIGVLPCWEVAPPQTNLVIARVLAPWGHAQSLCGPLRAAGVQCHPNVFREVRFALHLGIDDTALDAIVGAILATLAARRPTPTDL